jgi:hypothetical protein
MDNDIANTTKSAAVAAWYEPTDLASAAGIAERIAKTELVPSNYRNKPDNVLVAWSLGAPLGLSLLASLQNIAVINGKPAIFGDAALAVVRGSGLSEFVNEEISGEGDEMVATCTARRFGEPTIIKRTFSVADAKRAKLWGKQGPWTQYPQRMLAMRARSWCLRDGFPDALAGMAIREEVQDFNITDRVVVRDATPPQPQLVLPETSEPVAHATDDAADAKAALELRFEELTMRRGEETSRRPGEIQTEIEAAVGQSVDDMTAETLAGLVEKMESRVG